MMFIGIKNILPVVALLWFAYPGIAQQKEMREAYQDFADLQFRTASLKYLDALDKLEEDDLARRHMATFMLAECYRMMNDYGKAEIYYHELVNAGFGDTNPVIYLRWAEVCQTKGETDQAREYYKKYQKEDPRSQPAKLGIRSCDWISANQGRKARVTVTPVGSLNSSFDDFAPAPRSKDFDQLILTSNRTGTVGKHTDEWWGTPFSDLFVSTLSGDSWSAPQPLEKEGIINTEIHEGTAAFGGDPGVMYFTRCQRWDEKKRFCSVMVTTQTEDSWSSPETVFADTNANYGQPALSADGLTILFSSNIKDGKGGKDLYMATRNSKNEPFGAQENLGDAVNTAGNDMFPFLYNDTVLYFASDGREGYGGFDIYKSVRRGKNWSKPENLLAPINSGYDDFGFVLKSMHENKYLEEGYFTSNRPGGDGGDDIYRFDRRLLQFTISGQVKDRMTLLPVPGAKVILVEENRTEAQAVADAAGKFRFGQEQAPEETDFRMTVRKEGYFADIRSLSTKPLEDDQNISLDILLEPIPEKPIVLPDILYPLDQWILLPQYQDSLRGLVILMQENPSLVIELRSHTDTRGSFEYNDVLSQKRAQSVVDFMITEGIEPGRMVAKGYGERVFRTLDKDLVREGHSFKKGIMLDDEYIYSLPAKEIQEAAFQLNRRTEFAVIAKDYQPSGIVSGGYQAIEVVSDTSVQAVDYTLSFEGKMMVFTHLNDYSVKTELAPGQEISLIGEAIVLDLLRKGAINRNDFIGDFDAIMVDGHIADDSRLTIEKVRLGERSVKDVVLTVKKDAGERLIMGPDLLSGFGESRIDTEKRQIIFK